MSIFYFPLGDFFSGGGDYTFKESALINRAANLSKTKTQYLESQDTKPNGNVWLSANSVMLGSFHITGNL